jgi:capsid portal protein
MASRNQRRRKARQRATTTQLVVKREADHDVDGEVNPALLGSISKAAQSRQTKTKAQDVWDPNKTVPPPLPPDALWSIFESNSIHSGCINAKVADAVGRGWRLTPADPDQEGADDDAKKVARELEDLFESICPRLTFRQLMEQAARELDTIGWADWEVLRERDGDVESEIVGILPVPSMSIRACKDSDDVFCQLRGDKKVYFKRFGFEKHVDCTTGEIAEDVPEEDRANELVHFMHYTPRSSWYGIPPWVSAMPSIAEFAAIREFNVSYFESGGQADRHVHVTAKRRVGRRGSRSQGRPAAGRRLEAARRTSPS